MNIKMKTVLYVNAKKHPIVIILFELGYKTIVMVEGKLKKNDIVRYHGIRDSFFSNGYRTINTKSIQSIIFSITAISAAKTAKKFVEYSKM